MKKKDISVYIIRAFCRRMLRAVDGKATFPSSEIVGLCSNFNFWAEDVHVFTQHGSAFTDLLQAQFNSNSRTPFDYDFKTYRLDRSKYTNPKRLAWLREHANYNPPDETR